MRQRIHRKPDVDPSWVDPEQSEREEREKLHQKFIEGLTGQESVLKADASKNESPIKLSELEQQKETKLGKFQLYCSFH